MIAGSILSKKVAESPAALVIDVKLGKAAVIPDENYMIKLAQSMVRPRSIYIIIVFNSVPATSKLTSLRIRNQTLLSNLIQWKVRS